MSVRFGPSSDPGEKECGCVGASSRRLWCSLSPRAAVAVAARRGSGGGGGLGGATTTTAAEPRQVQDAPLKSTEIGVTPTTITVTVIADVNNSIRPGLFKGSWDGMKAWGDYINSQGGLACRKVVVKEGDAKLSPTDAANAVAAACGDSVAMVGTTALFLQDVSRDGHVQGQGRRGDGPPRHRRAADRGRAAVLADLVRDAADRFVVPVQRHRPAHVPRRLHAVRLLLQASSARPRCTVCS